MLEIHKKIVIDENQNPVAVQIPIEEFERLEEIIENYGLSKLMDETKDDERFLIEDAKKYYQSLKEHVESGCLNIAGANNGKRSDPQYLC